MRTYGHSNVRTYMHTYTKRGFSPANIYPVANARSYALCTVIEGVVENQIEFSNNIIRFPKDECDMKILL